jgi:hypothetical protein
MVGAAGATARRRSMPRNFGCFVTAAPLAAQTQEHLFGTEKWFRASAQTQLDISQPQFAAMQSRGRNSKPQVRIRGPHGETQKRGGTDAPSQGRHRHRNGKESRKGQEPRATTAGVRLRG